MYDNLSRFIVPNVAGPARLAALAASGRWTMTGTHTGPLDLLGLPPTVRAVSMSGQEIFRVADGRFVEVWHLEDIGALMRSLELEPPALMMRLAARRSARRYRKGR